MSPCGCDRVGEGAPPPPTVPPEIYDDEYFRTCCAGAETWEASGGGVLDGRYPGSLARAGLAPGEVLVDLGAGRGELVAAAVEAGAPVAVGIEYSPDALALARTTRAARGASGAAVVRADTRRVPLRDAVADVVTMLDVVEHLTPPELDASLREAHRLLRAGGRVVIHTMPTRTIYDVTYRLQRMATRRRRRTWPADPRNDWERRMHVNEQTRRGLRAALRHAGFGLVRVEVGAWVHDEFVPDERSRRLYARLARHRLTRSFGACDLWAFGTRR